MSSKMSKKEISDLIAGLCVLIVDDNQYMRKTVRNLLVNCGIKDIYEAPDGISALDTIRTVGPDVVILDWEMPLLSGAELVRIVRSPGVSRCRTCRSSCSADTASAGAWWKP